MLRKVNKLSKTFSFPFPISRTLFRKKYIGLLIPVRYYCVQGSFYMHVDSLYVYAHVMCIICRNNVAVVSEFNSVFRLRRCRVFLFSGLHYFFLWSLVTKRQVNVIVLIEGVLTRDCTQTAFLDFAVKAPDKFIARFIKGSAVVCRTGKAVKRKGNPKSSLQKWQRFQTRRVIFLCRK